MINRLAFGKCGGVNAVVSRLLMVFSLAGLTCCSVVLPEDPIDIQTVRGNQQAIAQCVSEALEREAVGKIQISNGPAKNSTILSLDTALRDFQATFTQEADNKTLIVVRSKVTMSGTLNPIGSRVAFFARNCGMDAGKI